MSSPALPANKLSHGNQHTPPGGDIQPPRTPTGRSWQTQRTSPDSSPDAQPGNQLKESPQGNTTSSSSLLPVFGHNSGIGASDNDFSNGGRAPSRSRSRRRRSRRRPSNPNLQQQLGSSPPIPAIPLQHLSNQTFPAGSSSSTFEIPYSPVLNQNLAPQQQLQQLQHLQALQALQLQSQNQSGIGQQQDGLPRNQQRNQQTRNLPPPARQRAPTAEHPVQVPVRVVNPDDLNGQKAGDGGKGGGNLRLRLDLNLDVEITLKASIRGDLTLALL